MTRAIIHDGERLVAVDATDLEGLDVRWQATEQEPTPPMSLLDEMMAQDAEPDWDGFAAWAISNTELNTIAGTAVANAPLAAAGLPTALLQVQSGSLSNFAATFNAVCTAGGATSQQRATWADLARDSYSLPPEFVAVVRGQ